MHAKMYVSLFFVAREHNGVCDVLTAQKASTENFQEVSVGIAWQLPMGQHSVRLWGRLHEKNTTSCQVWASLFFTSENHPQVTTTQNYQCPKHVTFDHTKEENEMTSSAIKHTGKNTFTGRLQTEIQKFSHDKASCSNNLIK